MLTHILTELTARMQLSVRTLLPPLGELSVTPRGVVVGYWLLTQSLTFWAGVCWAFMREKALRRQFAADPSHAHPRLVVGRHLSFIQITKIVACVLGFQWVVGLVLIGHRVEPQLLIASPLSWVFVAITVLDSSDYAWIRKGAWKIVEGQLSATSDPTVAQSAEPRAQGGAPQSNMEGGETVQGPATAVSQGSAAGPSTG